MMQIPGHIAPRSSLILVHCDFLGLSVQKHSKIMVFQFSAPFMLPPHLMYHGPIPLPILFIAEAGSPLLKLWCCKQSVVCAVLAGKQNDAFSSLEKVRGVFVTPCMLGNYTPRNLCLWEGILFSSCPSDCVSITFCFLNILKNY